MWKGGLLGANGNGRYVGHVGKCRYEEGNVGMKAGT